MKVGTKALFRNHTYQYAGELFIHENGGPTGLSYTGGAAHVRMLRWAKKLVKLLEENGIKVLMIYIYVDDVRIACQALKKGTKFCARCEKLFIDPDQLAETSHQGSQRPVGRPGL